MLSLADIQVWLTALESESERERERESWTTSPEVIINYISFILYKTI